MEPVWAKQLTRLPYLMGWIKLFSFSELVYAIENRFIVFVSSIAKKTIIETVVHPRLGKSIGVQILLLD